MIMKLSQIGVGLRILFYLDTDFIGSKRCVDGDFVLCTVSALMVLH
jgi:hypothetical protein